MSTTIGGVRIVDMPDLGAITDDSSMVGEHAGSGRFAATAFRTYVAGLGTGNIGRNLLHNPLFAVAQRGAGPWTAASSYTADRWFMGISGGTLSTTVSAVSDASRAQIGDEAANQHLVMACVGGAGATNETYIEERIEGVRRTAGKAVTISFWAVATAGTPKFGCVLFQTFGTGGSPSGAVAAAGQSVTLSTTYTRYSLSFTLPSVAGKVFGTNGGTDYLAVRFGLSAGATQSPGYGNIGVQSATFALWGVQLEVGNTASALEKPDPRYDLANCERFYVGSFSAGLDGWSGVSGQGISSMVMLPVTMRSLPTIAITPVSNTGLSAINASSISGFGFRLIGTTNLVGGSVAWVGNVTASADL